MVNSEQHEYPPIDALAPRAIWWSLIGLFCLKRNEVCRLLIYQLISNKIKLILVDKGRSWLLNFSVRATGKAE